MFKFINRFINQKSSELHVVSKTNTDFILTEEVGEFGRWQLAVLLLACLSCPSSTMFPLYANSIPQVRCHMGDTLESYFNASGEAFESVRNVTSASPDGCRAYDIFSTEDYELLKTRRISDLNSTVCRKGFVYSTSSDQYSDGIVENWDLVCQYSHFVPLGTFIYIMGMVVGIVLGGVLSDKFGRKPIALYFGISEMLFGFLVSFSPNYETYVLIRAVIGGLAVSRMNILMVYCIELTTNNYRNIVISTWSITLYFFSRALLSLEAYFIQNWRILHSVHNIPTLLVFLYIKFLPESPRWLISQGEYRNAAHVFGEMRIGNAASQKENHCVWIDHIHFALKSNSSNAGFLAKLENIHQNHLKLNYWKKFLVLTKKSLEVFLHPKLRFLTLLSIAVSSGQVFAYYGLMYVARNVHGNIYFNAFVNALMVIPASIYMFLVYRHEGSRKLPIIVKYILVALLMMLGGVYTSVLKPKNDIVLIVCVNISLICLQACQNMLVVYISELYPSEVRSQGSGYAAGISKIGGAFCVFLNEADRTLFHGFAFIVYSIVMFFEVFVFAFIPDTTGRNIKDRCETMNS